jgi:hypothetical protein
MMEFNMDAAFYAFNMVANFAYTRWNLIYPDLKAKIEKIEESFFEQVLEVDSNVLKMVDANNGDLTQAIQYATDFSVSSGNLLVQTWKQYFGELFVMYRDGYIIKKDASSRSCGCSVASAGYSQDWYDRIATDTRGHYLYEEVSPDATKQAMRTKKPAMSKLDLLARR